MSTIALHLNGRGLVLDSELYGIMEDAYQRACSALTAPLSVRQHIALTILELTRKGERDPKALCHGALATMDIEGPCLPVTFQV